MDYQFIQEKKQQIDQEISKVIIGMEDIGKVYGKVFRY